MTRIKSFFLLARAAVFDLAAVAFAWLASYSIRFDGQIPTNFLRNGELWLLLILPLYGAMFWSFGLYRGLWLFTGMADLIRLVKATLLSAMVTVIAAVLLQPQPPVPRTVLFLAPILLLVIVGGARAGYRSFKEFRRYGDLHNQGKAVFLIGAGQAAALLTRELARSSEWRLVGLLDDDPIKHGRELNGYPVLGNIASIARWAAEYKVSHAIIAIPSASLEQQKEAFESCIQNSIQALVIPPITGLDEGKPFLSRIRTIALDDLLRREPISIDTPLVEALTVDRVVMVTGAGGSIGSELCRQIAAFRPRLLVAFELSEFALYRLAEEFALRFEDVPIVALAGDVKDEVMLDAVMGRYQPSIIFHAAAYKHVPLMENGNAWPAIRNNVLGTLRLARCAVAHKVARFILISTDKAVNPTNVMGASKRLAEMVCQSLQQSSPHTAFETVRFGNVLGSDGSVVPKFQEQIARGGPVTVTHPDVTRYFMTIPEAVQLVLQASSMGTGGEIFMLDMGQPVKIVDLARDLIRLHGFTQDQIEIVFTGLRAGEKLFEELLADDETTLATPHAKLRAAKARDVDALWLEVVTPWLEQACVVDSDQVRVELPRWVPEYIPASDLQQTIAPAVVQSPVNA